MRRKLFIFWAVLSFMVILTVVAVAVWPRDNERGVKATIKNVGQSKMTDVRVVITGGEHAIGDLNSGETRIVYLDPSGESTIKIKYTEVDGTLRILEAGCYFEKHYSGQVTVDIADGKIAKVVNNISS